MGHAAIIGVDWGSTNLRAFRFDAEGVVADVRRAASGAKALRGDAFEATLAKVLGDWAGKSSRVVICGMVGGREGWIEAPYAPCPCDLLSLARDIIRAPARFAEVWIAPGARSADHSGRIDVMRGEETQILGGLVEEKGPIHVVAPGTHSKWAQVEGGRLVDFRTYMTGELFAVLKSHSILGRTMEFDAPDDRGAFDLGVGRALMEKGLLNLLFSARTEVLFKHVAPQAAPSYLSGVLIGAEIAEASARASLTPTAPIALIGGAELAARYSRAFELAGFTNVRTLDGEVSAARGLWRIAQERAR